jgi:predicted aspartyl protease
MMTGIVNNDLEALLRIRMQDSSGQSQEVEAVIDAGFNGFLTLSQALCADQPSSSQ